jgi:esterase/lipase superfamily enzyme
MILNEAARAMRPTVGRRPRISEAEKLKMRERDEADFVATANVTDCDWFASDNTDENAIVPQFAPEKAVSDEAVRACQRAIDEYPGSLRLSYQLAHTYFLRSEYDVALPLLRELEKANYPKAVELLAAMYERGLGVEMSMETSSRLAMAAENMHAAQRGAADNENDIPRRRSRTKSKAADDGEQDKQEKPKRKDSDFTKNDDKKESGSFSSQPDEKKLYVKLPKLNLDDLSTVNGGENFSSATQLIDVFFGTDRATRDFGSTVGFGRHRGRKLQLGVAHVSVPRTEHKLGIVERPNNAIFGLRLTQTKEDPRSHFVIGSIQLLSYEDWVRFSELKSSESRIFQSQALVFVHGYNTNFDDALFRAAQIAYDLQFDGPIYLYSWPSAGSPESYLYDRSSVAQSVPYFMDFLSKINNLGTVERFNLIAHSMGNVGLLELLNEFNLRGTRAQIGKLDQVIMAAPDVDRDEFDNLFQSIKAIPRAITLYASSNDRALQMSSNLAGGVLRLGEVGPSGPAVYGGMDTVDVSALKTDIFFSANHSTYSDNAVLMNDMALLLRKGLRPPPERTPVVKTITTTRGDYWRFP